MRIQPDELIAGFPARQTRDLLRRSMEFFPFGNVTRVLGIRGEKALRLLEAFEQHGLIEKNHSVSGTEQFWRNTTTGGALRNALCPAPVQKP